MRSAIVFIAVISLASCALFDRTKRQTYHYDESLLAYAHPHPGTRVQQGYLNRYAPQDWPKWYSRNMMKWDGESRISPYDRNDVRYGQYMSDFARASRN